MYAFLFEHLFSVLWVSTWDWNSYVTGQGLFLRHLLEVLGFSSFLKEAVQYRMDVKPQMCWLKETYPGQVHHKRPIGMGETDSKPPQGPASWWGGNGPRNGGSELKSCFCHGLVV